MSLYPESSARKEASGTPLFVTIYVAVLRLTTTLPLWPTKICKATDLSSIYLSPTYPLKHY